MRFVVLSFGLLGGLFGCGDDGAPPGDGGVDGAVDPPDGAVPDGGRKPDGGGRCVEATADTWFLDNYDDVSSRFGAPIRPDVDGRPYHLYVELRRFIPEPFVGTFELGTEADENYGTCSHCVTAFYGAMFDRGYFARSGTLTFRQDPFDLTLDATLEDAELVEVTIDGVDLTSTPVPDGGCIHFASIEVETTFGPPGWTCAIDEYGDGAECDCECGILDTDCIDRTLPIDGCAAEELCLPIARGVIGPFFGDSVCANDCDRASGVTCPTAEVCVDHAYGDVCIADPAEIDRVAPLGAPCKDGALYCAVDASGNADGLCDLFDRADGRCRPRCSVDADCDTSIFEHCYVTGSTTTDDVEVPFGYCALRYPAAWTCDPADYDDGATCDCGCGVLEPDCWADPALPVTGCAAGEVCPDGTCMAPP